MRPWIRPRLAVPSAAAAALALAVALVPAGAVPAGAVAAAPAPVSAAPVSAGPVSAGPAAASPWAATVADGRAAARQALAGTKASSISLALVDRGRVVWRETFGAVDAAGTKPSLDTLYGIGSVSKMLATVAVLQLVDAGKVSLDAPVTRYVPDFTMADPAYRQITVRMLLDHSAGLPGSDYANAMTTVPFHGYAAQVLDTLRTARLKTTPGSMGVYCNDCFTLAGVVVERVSGKAYTDYVHDAVLAPLGMARSTYATSVPAPGTYAPVLADGAAVPFEVTNIYASGGALSTPSEMASLATMLADGGVYRGRRILSAAAVAQMGTDQTATALDPVAPALQPFRFGLGWDTVAEPGLAAVGVRAWLKGGDTLHYHAGFVVAPRAKLSMVVLGAGTGFSSTVAETLAQRVLLHALVARGTVEALPGPLAAPALPRRTPTPAVLRAITGTYLASGSLLRVAAGSGGALSLATWNGSGWTTGAARYTLRRDGAFWSDGSGGQSLRTARAWGRTYLMATRVGGLGHYREEFALAERGTAGAPLPPAWRARTGRTWLLANELPTSFGWAAPTLALDEVPGLPGYVLATASGSPQPVDPGAGDALGAMFLVVPTAQGRDLNDVVVTVRDGQEWLRTGHMVWRPADGVAALAAGAQDVAVGAEGYAEWRRAPAAGTATVTGATTWMVFGADLAPLAEGGADGGAPEGTAVPAGGYLVVHAAPGASVRVAFAPRG